MIWLRTAYEGRRAPKCPISHCSCYSFCGMFCFFLLSLFLVYYFYPEGSREMQRSCADALRLLQLLVVQEMRYLHCWLDVPRYLECQLFSLRLRYVSVRLRLSFDACCLLLLARAEVRRMQRVVFS